MNYFTIKERQVGDVIVLDIYGKLKGCGGRGTLRDAITHPLEKGHNQILLNLAHVSDIDSSCLGELVSSHLYLMNKGGKMKMVHLSQKIRELMIITKLLTTFNVYDDEADALNTPMNNTLDPVRQAPIFRPGDLNPLSWGALGMSVTFRAELMQNRSRFQRTFSVKELLPSGLVTLNGINGQYMEETFEPVQYAV